MLADTTVSVVVSSCDHGNVVRSTRCGCPSTSAQTSIPPFPMEPDNSYVTRLGLNSGTACGPRTVVTGGGVENSCTFHINTAPKESATTATNGLQTRAKTVLPTERGLTPSPFGIRSPTSWSRFVPGPGVGATPLGHISTRLRYDRYDTTSLGRNGSKRCETLSPADAVGSTYEPTSNSPEINETATPHALCCFKPLSVVALSTLRCGEAEWRGLWRSTWGSARGMSARKA